MPESWPSERSRLFLFVIFRLAQRFDVAWGIC